MLLFCDSFRHYTADNQITEKWGSSGSGSWMSISSTNGRDNGAALKLEGLTGSDFIGAGWVSKRLAQSATTLMVGFRLKVLNSGSVHHDTLLVGVRDGIMPQCGIGINTAHQLQAYVGNGFGWSALGAPSDTTLAYSTLYHIEIKFVIDSSAGSIEARVNATSEGWLNLTSQDTQGQTTNSANDVLLACGAASIGGSYQDRYFSDFYVLDDSGSYNNDFMGEMKVDCLLPSGAGQYAQWTPSSGANYACVDDTAASDADYVTAGADGLIDTYAFADLSGVAPSIKAVVNTLWQRKYNSGTAYIKSMCRRSGADYAGDSRAATVDWMPQQHIYETDPSGGVWTAAHLNASEFGARLSLT